MVVINTVQMGKEAMNNKSLSKNKLIRLFTLRVDIVNLPKLKSLILLSMINQNIEYQINLS